MEPERHLDIVQTTADTLDLSPAALADHVVSGDVSSMEPEHVTQLLVALAHQVGVSPLMRPFIIVDGKIYPTAACAAAIRFARKLECSATTPAVVEIGDQKLLMSTAECCDPNTGRSEKAHAYLPYGVEEVTKWGQTSSGKRFPEVKIWRDPTPDEFANMCMKVMTKAERRATLKFDGMATSSAEDVPGNNRVWVEAVPDDAPPLDEEHHVYVEEPPEPPHHDEAGAVPAAPQEQPTCTGEFGHIAYKNKLMADELAKLDGRETTSDNVWSWACKSAGIESEDEGYPVPGALYLDEGNAVAKVLDDEISRRREAGA